MSGAVVALRVPEPERYLTRRQLADIMGVSVTTIDRWKRPGMPHEHPQPRAHKSVRRAVGNLPLDGVTDAVVAEWLAGGTRNGTVPALRAMFNDAASAKAGRLIEQNPFAGLGGRRATRERQPPDEEAMERLVARELTPPPFAANLEFACVSGARPGELDALRWDRLRFDDNEVDLSPNSGEGAVLHRAEVRPVHDRARQPCAGRAAGDEARGDRLAVRVLDRARHALHAEWPDVLLEPGPCCSGRDDTLYLATRHYFGCHALNVLGLEPHVIAAQFGHKDGGRLVVQLYGHPDRARARRRIREAYDATAQVRHLRVVSDE